MKIALFDLFGTLADAPIDDQRLDPEYQLIKEFGLAPQDDQDFYDQVERVTCGGTPYNSEQQYVREVMEKLGIHLTEPNLEKTTAIIRSQGKLAELVPGTIEVLQEIRGVTDRIALISNAYPPAVIHLKRSTPLFDYIDDTFLSYQRGSMKQDENGGLFAIAMEEIGFEPEEAIMIGDNHESDIVCAKNLDIRGIWISSFVPNAEKLFRT